MFSVLAVGPFDDHLLQLIRILSKSGCQVDWAEDLEQAEFALSDREFPVVLCDVQYKNGTWRDVTASAERLRRPPFVIVTATQASDGLWEEVLTGGAYAVLAKPFIPEEVVRSVSRACRWWGLDVLLRAPGSRRRH